MRKFSLLLSIICLMMVAKSIKTASPNESTTIDFLITNPGGQYEFCIDSVLIQFTNHIGDIKVVTPMPAYPRMCICPAVNKTTSTCLADAGSGKAYGQSQGYSYSTSSTYRLSFNISVDPNPDSTLLYPGVEHDYQISYSYKFVNCQIGCWFENPQQQSYSDIMYIHGITQDEISSTSGKTIAEKVAANAIADAQQDLADAFNAVDGANSTISLASAETCMPTSEADLHLSAALSNYSEAESLLLNAQAAYASKDYNYSLYNATLARQFAIQTKNEADVATTIIQTELQRVESLSGKLTQANLSLSYSTALAAQAKEVGVVSSEASSLIALAVQNMNEIDAACKNGEYDEVSSSADAALEKANQAKSLLEPIVKSKLVELFNSYAQNLSNISRGMGVFSSNYSNSTINELIDYKDNIKNGTFTNYLLYITAAQATEENIERTVSTFAEINKTIPRLNNLASLAQQYNQQLNLSSINILLQNSVAELSNFNFNSSMNLTQEANSELAALEKELSSKIAEIKDTQASIEAAESAMNDTESDRIFIIGPDMSESEVALKNAQDKLYSQPDRAGDFAREARALAVEQKRRVESIKLGIVGVVIIIILLAVIISRIASPFKIARRRWDKY